MYKQPHFAFVIIILIFIVNIKIVNCNIKNVHIIFSNHVDMGFNSQYSSYNEPAFTINIINIYFDLHFPQILTNINQLSGININYVYTLQPYLIYLYLHCEHDIIPTINNITLHCPNNNQINDFKKAIFNGNIVWQALPFNIHSEMQNEIMFQNQINLVRILDDEFKQSYKTVINQRDVPGITAGVIPILIKNNIKAISIGANELAGTPEVPNIFRWKHPTNSNLEVIMMMHVGGYGGYQINDCVIIPNYSDALCYYYRTDNAGPGSYIEVINVLKTVQVEFPNATVFPSSFEKYIATLPQDVIDKLPIIQAEIGDTWDHGMATDPKKLQYFRHIQRFIETKINQNQWNLTDPILLKFMLRLQKVTEHTFGLDETFYLDDPYNWENTDFHEAKKLYGSYQIMINSWAEQRKYLSFDLMQSHPILKELYNELNELDNMYSNLTNQLSYYTIPIKSNTVLYCNDWNISFGYDGNINYLRNIKNNDNNIVFTNIGFEHQTLSDKDMNIDYIYNYSRCGNNCPEWFTASFGKPNIGSFAKTMSAVYAPKTLKVIKQQNTCKYVILAQPQANNYGPAELIMLFVDLTNNSTANLSLLIQNKTATRLPEAYWFSFLPIIKNNNTNSINKWFVHKVNSMIPINNVVKNGTSHLHATINGIYYFDKNNTLNINSLDTGLISVGVQMPMATPFEIEYADPKNIYFLLNTNIWSTNYPSWYPFLDEDKNLFYRFSVNIN